MYILASRPRNLYTGMTGNLNRRLVEHQQRLIPGFARKYRIRRLVYFELFAHVRDAVRREKQIKSWRRGRKVALITGPNPTWEDLTAGLYGKGEADPSGRRAGPRD